MALIKSFEPLPGFIAENAYHHIAKIGDMDFTNGKMKCLVVTYKDQATRDAHKVLVDELKVMGAENEILHKALSAAQQEQDQVKIATAQRDIAVKSAEITVKANELSKVRAWATQEVSFSMADILAANGDVTRADAYAKLKEQEGWTDATDAL